MSAQGCGFPTDFGGEHAICGTYLALGELVPILCAPCQRAQRAPESTCEGCRVSPATRTAPALCDACAGEYAADLVWLDAHNAGEPGTRCTAACGQCGRCGGA